MKLMRKKQADSQSISIINEFNDNNRHTFSEYELRSDN